MQIITIRRHKALILSLGFFLLLAGLFPCKSQARVFRYNPQHNGETEHIGPGKGSLKWSVNVYSRPSYLMTPVEGKDGTIYVTGLTGDSNRDFTHTLFAVSREGKILRKFDYPSAYGHPVTSPAISSDGSAIYLYAPVKENGTDNGVLYAVSLKDWKILFKTKIERGGPSLHPITAASDGTVYIGTFKAMINGIQVPEEAGIAAVDGKGNIKWRFRGHLMVSSPALSPDERVVYITTAVDTGGAGTLIALNADTGEKLWEFNKAAVHPRNSIAVGRDGTVYVPGRKEAMEEASFIYGLKARPSPKGFDIGYNIFDAKEHHTYKSNPAVSKDNILYVDAAGERDSGLIAFDPNGKERWRYRVQGTPLIAPSTIDGQGKVYFIDYQGNLYCLSPDGKLLWKLKIGDGSETYGTPPVIGRNGTVYAIGGDGYLYAVGK